MVYEKRAWPILVRHETRNTEFVSVRANELIVVWRHNQS